MLYMKKSRYTWRQYILNHLYVFLKGKITFYVLQWNVQYYVALSNKIVLIGPPCIGEGIGGVNMKQNSGV